MKRVSSIIPIIIIVVMNMLYFVFAELNEISSFSKIKGYDTNAISIPADSDTNSSKLLISEIQKLAQQHNVILTKTNVASDIENGNDIYISLSIEEMTKMVKQNFNVTLYEKEKNSQSYFSTYHQNQENQVGIIHDLFQNNHYNYYVMDELIEKGNMLEGNYFVYYKDFQDYAEFVNDVEKLTGSSVSSFVFFSNNLKYISILAISSFIFLLLFYFIFQIYSYYNQSKKIGCMKLLGFDNRKINSIMLGNKIKIYGISSLIMLLLFIIFIKNISLSHILFILLLDIIIILMTFLVSRFVCYIITKSYNIGNILKKENIGHKVSYISYKLKAIMTILILLFLVIGFGQLQGYNESLKLYRESKNLLDYSVIAHVNGIPKETNEYEKHTKFYLGIIHDPRLETLYAYFHDYTQYTKTDLEKLKEQEELGISFNFDSVDRTYLQKEKIKVYNLDGEIVNVDSIKGVFFLFPKSKLKYIEPFGKYYGSYFKDNFVYQPYLYDDIEVDTYSTNLANKKAKGRIIRVIDNSIDKSDFESSFGINMFGYGMDTGLKIKVGDKNQTFEIINEHITSSGLNNLLNTGCYESYREYFNDEILLYRIVTVLITSIILIISITYFLITMQVFNIYIRNSEQEVLVKKLLGFSKDHIFNHIFKNNMIHSVISFIIAFIILLIMKKLTIVVFMIAIILFLILDFICVSLSIKLSDFSKIHLKLKGEKYD